MRAMITRLAHLESADIPAQPGQGLLQTERMENSQWLAALLKAPFFGWFLHSDRTNGGIRSMKSQSNNAITLKINGQKVQINNEIKGAWFKMINNTRNTARSTHSCGQSDYRLCCGDCPLCPWKVSGIIMSFSNTHFNGDTETIPGGFVLADAAPGPAEIAESDDTVERILKYARTVCEDGDLILTMRMEGLPGKEIASRLAVPKRTMERRIKKLMAEIRDYYINFFM